ncbi:hypothetical protein EDB89DRAFT_2245874 [Lactarius sanguifluus]|nr:hypothetical protein EDB89DRAFT_2245874 [Lactarius sanguifluus]
MPDTDLKKRKVNWPVMYHLNWVSFGYSQDQCPQLMKSTLHYRCPHQRRHLIDIGLLTAMTKWGHLNNLPGDPRPPTVFLKPAEDQLIQHHQHALRCEDPLAAIHPVPHLVNDGNEVGGSNTITAVGSRMLSITACVVIVVRAQQGTAWTGGPITINTIVVVLAQGEVMDGTSVGVPEVVANNSIALILENMQLDVAQQVQNDDTILKPKLHISVRESSQNLRRSFYLTQLQHGSLHLEKHLVKQKIEEHEISLQALKEWMADVETRKNIASTTNAVISMHCYMDQVGIPIPDMLEHVATSIMFSDLEDDDAIDPQDEDTATSEENKVAPGSWHRYKKLMPT